jgi:hypothetical protein
MPPFLLQDLKKKTKGEKVKLTPNFPNSRIEKNEKNSCPLPPSRINKKKQKKFQIIKE